MKKSAADPATLEYWIHEHLLPLVEANYQQAPFSYLVIESGLTQNQVHEIHDLMGQVQGELTKSKVSMSHQKFEAQVYKIVPSHKGDYHFAESIVAALYGEGKYKAVYPWMKKSGMNLT